MQRTVPRSAQPRHDSLHGSHRPRNARRQPATAHERTYVARGVEHVNVWHQSARCHPTHLAERPPGRFRGDHERRLLREMHIEIFGHESQQCLTQAATAPACIERSEEHTSELQSLRHLVCRLLLEKKKQKKNKAETSNAD